MSTNADNLTNINQLTLDPNILGAYQSYTYNFKLKLYEQKIMGSAEITSSSDRSIIIAESGVTAMFNIKRVEIRSIPGTTTENRGALSTQITIELEEPLGFTFIDRLLQAGKDLGLPSLNLVP